MEHSSDSNNNNSRGHYHGGGRRYSAGRRQHRGPRHDDRRDHMHPPRRHYDHSRYHDGSMATHPPNQSHHHRSHHRRIHHDSSPLQQQQQHQPHLQTHTDEQMMNTTSLGFSTVSQTNQHSMTMQNPSMPSMGMSPAISRAILDSNPSLARRDDQMRFPHHTSSAMSSDGNSRAAPMTVEQASEPDFTMPVPSPSMRSSTTQPIPVRGQTNLPLAAPPMIPFPGVASALGAGSVPMSSVPMSAGLPASNPAAAAAANQLLFQQLIAQQMSQSQSTQPIPGSFPQSSAATVASLNALTYAFAAQQEKQQLWREASTNGRSVWVGNLKSSVDKDKLKRFFESCGPVESVTIPKRTADTKMVFAYIRFSNESFDQIERKKDRAVAALKESELLLQKKQIETEDSLLAQAAKQSLDLGDGSSVVDAMATVGDSNNSNNKNESEIKTDNNGSADKLNNNEENSEEILSQDNSEDKEITDEQLFLETGEIPLGYHCAKNAVDRLNYAIFDGKEIHVEFLNSSQNWMGMSRLEYTKYLESNGCKIYLKNLPFKTKSRDLYLHFKNCCNNNGGKIILVYIARYSSEDGLPTDNKGLAYAKGSGYILYDNPQSAQTAVHTLNGSRWQGVGEPIIVEPFFSPLTKYAGTDHHSLTSYYGHNTNTNIISAETSQFGGLNIPSYIPSTQQGSQMSVGSNATSADESHHSQRMPKTVVKFANIPQRYANEEAFKKFLELNGIWVTTVSDVSVSAPQDEIKVIPTAQMRVKELVEKRLKQNQQAAGDSATVEEKTAEIVESSEVNEEKELLEDPEQEDHGQKKSTIEEEEKKKETTEEEEASSEDKTAAAKEKSKEEESDSNPKASKPVSPIFTVEIRFKSEASARVAARITNGLGISDDKKPVNVYTIVTTLEHEPPATPAATKTDLNTTSMPIPSVSNASMMSGSGAASGAQFSFGGSTVSSMFGGSRVPVTSALISQPPPGVPTFKPHSIASLPQSSVMTTPPGISSGTGRMVTGQPTMKPPTPAQPRPLKKSAFLPVHTPAKSSLL